MFINILDLNIHYRKEGSGSNVIFIHGWGQSTECFNYLLSGLKNKHTVYALDLPGFGKSEEPKYVYNTNDYSTIVLEFIKALKIKSPTLIGHSFGGKVIIDLVTKNNYHPHKIVLIDSAGIQKKKTLLQKFNIFRYKLLKKIILKIHSEEKANYLISNLQKQLGSKDYNNAKGIMKDILVTVVNEDYKERLSQIKFPTLLLWGENDNATPLEDGKRMEKEINDSGLVIIKRAGHFPFLQFPHECFIIIDNFLEN